MMIKECESTVKFNYKNIDPDLIDLFPSYLSKRFSELIEVEALLKVGNFKDIEVIGHKLCGNAGLFGLDELAKKAFLLEQAAKSFKSAEVLSISMEMLAILEEIRLFIL